MHTPQPTSLEYLKTFFQSPFILMTVDAIKAAVGSSVDMIARFKD
jgi:hypothetical protein